jgi:hypothetical protein
MMRGQCLQVAVATFAMHSQDFDVGNTDFLEDELDDDGIGDGGQEFEFSTVRRVTRQRATPALVLGSRGKGSVFRSRHAGCGIASAEN